MEFLNIKAPEFVKLLSENKMKIEFEKLDGAIRNMIATRMKEYIPEDQYPSNNNLSHEYNEITDETDSVKVFDLQVCGWRTVKPSKLISVEIYNG